MALKFAVTLFAEVTFVSVQVAPAQSQLQAEKPKPAFAVAVQVLDPSWPTGFGAQLTVPAPAGFTEVVMA